MKLCLPVSGRAGGKKNNKYDFWSLNGRSGNLKFDCFHGIAILEEDELQNLQASGNKLIARFVYTVYKGGLVFINYADVRCNAGCFRRNSCGFERPFGDWFLL